MTDSPLTEELQNQVPEQVQQTQEQVVPQSHVNKLVGSVKKESYERGRQDALREMQMQQQQMTGAPMQQQTQQPINPAMSPDDIRRIVAEESIRQQQQAVGNHIANQFLQKIQMGKDSHPDFEEKVKPILPELEKYPHVLLYATNMDNTADIMHDIANNPHKLLQIEQLAERSPQLAQIEMTKLSNSIKQNRTAAQAPQVNEPLSQIKPSTVGADNGSKTISDLRRDPFLRG